MYIIATQTKRTQVKISHLAFERYRRVGSCGHPCDKASCEKNAVTYLLLRDTIDVDRITGSISVLTVSMRAQNVSTRAVQYANAPSVGNMMGGNW